MTEERSSRPFLLVSSWRSRATACAAWAVTLLAASFLAQPADAEPCPADRPSVDLGAHALAFADPGDGTFEGTGVAGTLRIHDQGLTALVHGTREGDAVDLDLRFPGAELQPTGVDSSAGGPGLRVERFTFGEAGGYSLPAVDTVEARDAYPGVDLRITADQRRLWLTFDAESAGALGAVRWAVPGAEPAPSPDGSRVLLWADTLSSPDGEPAGRRGFEWELVALDASERRLAASFELEDDADGEPQVAVRLLETVRGPVRVLLTALLGRHTEPADVEVMDDGRLVTVMSSRVEAGSERTAALLHELDPDGGTLLSSTLVSSTLVSSAQELEIRGLAKDASGRLILAGRAGENATVLALDMEARHLQTVQAVEELAAPWVDDAVVSGDGRLLLVATGAEVAGTEIAGQAGELGTLTLALPTSKGSETDPAFVAAVDLESDTVTAVLPFQASRKHKRPRAWLDCHGQIHIGFPWLAAAMTASHTYSITVPSSDFQNCPRIEESHGFGALCWKARRSVTNWTYHPFNVSFTDVPSTLVYIRDPNDPNAPGISDHTQLNRLEANQHGNLYYHVPTSQWDDPGGGWGADLNWAVSKEELAIAAALYQERWLSPIFANLRVPTDLDPAALRAVMLREETFSAPTAAELPHNICDDDFDNDGNPDWNPSAWPKPPEHQVAAACATNPDSAFTLDHVRYDTWRVGAAYIPDQSLSGSDTSWWPFFSPYVGDPPENGAPTDLRNVHLREIAGRLSSRAHVPVTLELTTISPSGSVTVQQSAWISAVHQP